MIIEEMLKGNEQLLWSGHKNEQSTFWESVFNPLLPVAFLWCLFDFGFIAATGILNLLLSGLILFFLLHLLPVWIYLGRILNAKNSARNTRYAITTNGIYIQRSSKFFGQDVQFYPFDEIRCANTQEGTFDQRFHVGDVVCDYVTPIVKYTSKGTRYITSFSIDNVADHQQIAMLINQQIQQYAQAQSESSTNAAVSERNVLTERNIPASYGQMQNNPPVISKPKPAADAQTVVDPQAAFFGQPTKSLFPTAAPNAFLNTMSEEEQAFLESLPDESVSDLQTELFGADAKLSDAFPDPTVNPLPVFQEEAAPVFQEITAPVFPQKTASLFPDYQNNASPYALPQDQPAPWSRPEEPEMEPLFPDEQKEENTDDFFFRSSL